MNSEQSKKRAGRPRKTPQGGKAATFYLPVEVAEYVKEHGGAEWIRRKVKEEREETK